MPRPKGSKNKPRPEPVNLTQKEGFLYVYPDGSQHWESSDVTIETMQKLRTNADASSLVIKLLNLIFPPTHPTIKITDEKGKKDEELAARIDKMIKRQDVALYRQMKKAFSALCYDAYIFNYVIERADDGFIELSAIRDLPAASFSTSAFSSSIDDIHAVLLPGINYNSKDENIHYYQTDVYGTVNELKYVTHFRPPGQDDYDIVGLPLFYDLVPSFNRSNFAWIALMQTINRAGAPSIFLKIQNPTKVDMELAKKILQNYSKNNQFSVPGNFEVIEVGKDPNDIALQAINMINSRLSAQFSPSDFIATDGSLLGGSDEAKSELLDSFISGMQGHIVDQFAPFLERILEYNGYVDYSISIEFPERKFKNGTLDQLRAEGGAALKVIDKNEYRQLIGLNPKTPEELEEIKEDWGPDVVPAAFPPNNPLAPQDQETEETTDEKKPNDDEKQTDEEITADKMKKNQLELNQDFKKLDSIIDKTANGIEDGWNDLLNAFSEYLKKKVKV